MHGGAAEPHEPAHARGRAGAIGDLGHADDLRGVANRGVDADVAALQSRGERRFLDERSDAPVERLAGEARTLSDAERK